MSKKASNTKDEQDDPVTFRPLPKVEEWWKEYKATKNKNNFKLNQALNLGLAKFLGRQDQEIKDLVDDMREPGNIEEVQWGGSAWTKKQNEQSGKYERDEE